MAARSGGKLDRKYLEGQTITAETGLQIPP